MEPINGTGDVARTVDPWRDLALGELEAERARLEAEIAAAKARSAAARHRIAERDAEVRAALRAELLASKETIAEMERRHQTELLATRDGSRSAVDRILEEAQRTAAVGAPTPVGTEIEQVNGVE